EQYFTVFAGSSVEDVSYAKLFWSSASLNPPLESRLVSGDTRQRLRTAGGPQARESAHAGPGPGGCEEFLHEAYLQQKAEEKQRYLEKAKKREELLALLQKQRADRIRKEKISQPYRPK
uniref:Cilia- and flagella-associated protein HOATZ n=1 Tax=Lepisosteus oculatus TaxID=7918 RepID=W5LZ34_LEPOC